MEEAFSLLTLQLLLTSPRGLHSFSLSFPFLFLLKPFITFLLFPVRLSLPISRQAFLSQAFGLEPPFLFFFPPYRLPSPDLNSTPHFRGWPIGFWDTLRRDEQRPQLCPQEATAGGRI